MNESQIPENEKKEIVLIERNELEKKDDEKMIELDKVIDFANLAVNSVIVLKIGGGLEHKMQMHRAFVRFVQNKEEVMKDKRLTFLFLEPDDTIDVLTEADMDKAG
jgi:hypothetical protein